MGNVDVVMFLIKSLSTSVWQLFIFSLDNSLMQRCMQVIVVFYPQSICPAQYTLTVGVCGGGVQDI